MTYRLSMAPSETPKVNLAFGQTESKLQQGRPKHPKNIENVA